MNTQEIISNEQVSSLERIAAIIAKSGMGGFRTPEQATVALLLALAEGIPLGRVIHEYHVINGRLSLRSECMLARFQKAGGSVEYHIHNDTEVSLTASHPKGGSLMVVWTIERARKSGLTSNPTWAKHPAAMLTARAIAEAVRAVYPACLSGILVEEEAEEVAALESAPLPTPPTRRTRGNGSTTPAGIQLTPARPVAASEPEPAAREAVTLTVVPEAPAPQPEALEPAAVATAPELPKRGSGGIQAFWHPLDEALGALDQEKLSEFLFKLDMVQLGQNYKYCGPKATSRILKQLPSFLKAGGFNDAGFDQ
jgi:hypothetical protein